MSMTNLPSAPLELATNTVVGRIYHQFTNQESSTGTRILIIVPLAIFMHVLVKTTRHFSEWLIHKGQAQQNPLGFVTHQPKFITLTRLIVSALPLSSIFLRSA